MRVEYAIYILIKKDVWGIEREKEKGKLSACVYVCIYGKQIISSFKNTIELYSPYALSLPLSLISTDLLLLLV